MNNNHIGNFKSRKVDVKRRLRLPSKIRNDVSVFIPVQETPDELRLYSYPVWLQRGSTSKVKDELYKKSSSMQTVDVQGRILLPQGISWKVVDVTGMMEYILITQSVE
jgi:DNA-binding transcriptional regulator/RsmH inhibitor MraZ